MVSTASREWLRAARVVAVSCAVALSAGAAASAAAGESAREHAFNVGVRAYKYGDPLLETQRIYRTITSVTVPGVLGEAPANHFSHFKELATTKEGAVIAPNADTLYSIAELKLNSQPIVITVPAPEPSRLNVVEFVSPYTENFVNIGTGAPGLLAPGNYAVAGPTQLVGEEETTGFKGESLKVIHSPYDQVWLIARTVVKDPEDVPYTVALQEEEHLVPLKHWIKEGESYIAPAPKKNITTPTTYHVPGTHEGESPLRFWSALAKALAKFPPPAADAGILAELAELNIGPGKRPTAENTGKEALTGLEEAVRAGPETIKEEVLAALHAGFAAHDGWLVAAGGHYETNYALRAIFGALGIGALTPNVSVYPTAITDHTGTPLTGAKRYVVHFPASDFPVPVEGFWSLTLYETSGFFVGNPLNRYTLGDRSNLQFNLDGSLDVYVQSSEPSTEAQRDNWLPAPSGGFQLVMRLYGTSEEALPGILEGGPGHWTPPAILPCLEDGETETGLSCAT